MKTRIYVQWKAFEEIADILNQFDYNRPDRIKKVERIINDISVSYCVLTWEDITWNDFSEWGIAMDEKISELLHNNEEGYGFKQLIIGERLDDTVEIYNDTGCIAFEDFYIVRNFNVE
jgi:hypothetical protein